MGDKQISRRRFLWVAGGALGAGMLMCGGVATTMAAPTPALNFGQSSCGKGRTMQQVLVAYASRCGSTAEVGQAIADQLCQRGATVDVRAVEEVQDVTGYDAVVLGSAIRMGKWLPAALQFVERNAAALQTRQTAFFTVHMLNSDDSEASRQARAAYVEPVHALLTPQHEAFFAGKMDMSQLSFLDRMVAKMVKAKDEDKRNWPAIQAWGRQIFAA
jgi:menaquinone-dependent protoporphyrinogen oxidase